MEKYQDLWVKGNKVSSGVRECDSRYEIIREFAGQYKRPFTVLDIGAAFGYFSLRLTEEFDCTAVAIEWDPRLPDILVQNENPSVILLQKRISFEGLKELAEVEHFDIVLAMSIVHHLGAAYHEVLQVLESLGDHLIVELPSEEPRACGQEVLKEGYVPDEATIIGYGISHLHDNVMRPIFHLSTKKKNLSRPFLGAPESCRTKMNIISNFSNKRVLWKNGKEPERNWLRGINLQTYLKINGVYPTRKQIAGMLMKNGLPAEAHNDIEPWNVVLQGDNAVLIDYSHNNSLNGRTDKECFERLIRILNADRENDKST